MLYTYLNHSLDKGDPVEHMVLKLERSWFFFGITFLLFKVSIYFALIPKRVIYSSAANSNNKSSFLYIGKPSKRSIVAPDERAPTNQFHIIHPHVVK